jgi:hypothetical protein
MLIAASQHQWPATELERHAAKNMFLASRILPSIIHPPWPELPRLVRPLVRTLGGSSTTVLEIYKPKADSVDFLYFGFFY